MKVFIFDLLAYGENLDHIKQGTELPYPLSQKHFKADVAARTYAEHLEAWEALDRLGYDGVGFNEHHCSPYGLMNSPNLMASAAAQRTKKLKLLIYGNLLPLHEPLRLAEELAMLDCLSNGRIISGFARGIPREYQVHNVPLSQSRERFEEAYEIVTRAWTEDVFSYSGKYWSYKDVALWPRPLQKPHPPIMIPIVGSQESIEFAGRHNIGITPGLAGGGLRDDIIRHYAKSLKAAGHRITPDHLSLALNAYVADSKAQAVREVAPYHLYFNRTLFSHGNFTETAKQRQAGHLFDFHVRRARHGLDELPRRAGPLAQEVEVRPEDLHGEVRAHARDHLVHAHLDRLSEHHAHAGQRREPRPLHRPPQARRSSPCPACLGTGCAGSSVT